VSKKSIAVVLCLVILLSLVACGGRGARGTVIEKGDRMLLLRDDNGDRFTLSVSPETVLLVEVGRYYCFRLQGLSAVTYEVTECEAR